MDNFLHFKINSQFKYHQLKQLNFWWISIKGTKTKFILLFYLINGFDAEHPLIIHKF